MKIAICNYTFQASNGKKTVLDYSVFSGSLVWSSVEEITLDPSGRNMACLRRQFLRDMKGKSGLNEFKIKFIRVKIIKFYGTCQNIV